MRAVGPTSIETKVTMPGNMDHEVRRRQHDHEIGNRVYSLRRGLGLGQKELATTIGCKQSQISEWETGAHVPRQPRLGQLARALNSSIPYIMTGEDRREGNAPDLQRVQATRVGLRHVINGFESVATDPWREGLAIGGDVITDDFMQFQNVKSADDLLRRAEPRLWRYDVIHAIRDTSKDVNKLARYSARALIEAFRSGDRNSVGFISNVLAVVAAKWRPERAVLAEMKKIVQHHMKGGDLEGYNHLQSLVSALARKGQDDLAGAFLQCLLNEPQLRIQEWTATLRYYGNWNVRYSAYIEHGKETRAPAFACWDLPTLMVELLRAPRNRAEHVAAPIVRQLLQRLDRFDHELSSRLAAEAKQVIRSRRNETG
jgi:transcriptional regulator with XRE-family HTH domain